MTAPALVLDVSEVRSEAAPRRKLSLVVVDGSNHEVEATARAKLAALITAQLWSSILGRRGDRLDRTISSAVHTAVNDLGRELGR